MGTPAYAIGTYGGEVCCYHLPTRSGDRTTGEARVTTRLLGAVCMAGRTSSLPILVAAVPASLGIRFWIQVFASRRAGFR